MNDNQNIFGLTEDDTKVDPHLMKNSEWGAVVYLTQSIYGKNDEVWNNSNINRITGMCGTNVDAANEETGVTYAYNTEIGTNASTTGNIYGIYDMSGGAWDMVASYINSSTISDTSSLIYQYGKEIVTNTNMRYKDVYNVGIENTPYNNSIANAYKYGDSMFETSCITSDVSTITSWYNDDSFYPTGFFCRGGQAVWTTTVGIYAYQNRGTGDNHVDHGFRVAITVN